MPARSDGLPDDLAVALTDCGDDLFVLAFALDTAVRNDDERWVRDLARRAEGLKARRMELLAVVETARAQ